MAEIMDPQVILRRACILDAMGKLRVQSSHIDLRMHLDSVRNLLAILTAEELLDARPPTPIHCDNHSVRFSSHAVKAMLELDRLTEVLLADLGNTSGRLWGYMWLDFDPQYAQRRVLRSCDGEEAREKVRAALFTKTGRLTVKVCRRFPLDTPTLANVQIDNR